MFESNFPCACITLEPGFFVFGLPPSSSHDFIITAPPSPVLPHPYRRELLRLILKTGYTPTGADEIRFPPIRRPGRGWRFYCGMAIGDIQLRRLRCQRCMGQLVQPLPCAQSGSMSDGGVHFMTSAWCRDGNGAILFRLVTDM